MSQPLSRRNRHPEEIRHKGGARSRLLGPARAAVSLRSPPRSCPLAGATRSGPAAVASALARPPAEKELTGWAGRSPKGKEGNCRRSESFFLPFFFLSLQR